MLACSKWRLCASAASGWLSRTGASTKHQYACLASAAQCETEQRLNASGLTEQQVSACALTWGLLDSDAQLACWSTIKLPPRNRGARAVPVSVYKRACRARHARPPRPVSQTGSAAATSARGGPQRAAPPPPPRGATPPPPRRRPDQAAQSGQLSPVRAGASPQSTARRAQEEFKRLAADFAARELAPHAARWDADKEFSVSTLRAAAGLGFGGLFCGEDVGGSALSRADGAVIFEVAACVAAAL